jgi:hypothetical protein
MSPALGVYIRVIWARVVEVRHPILVHRCERLAPRRASR